ncbi:MAG: TRAP transporter small permease subunit [Gammaproteobacteria bacterium]|nr:TRAP transporter small permease subunit [Rhodocyclaceae bacterium]MBU3907676.1 TRAP transporter small permease subunit [Gammaproteobacteria bacterium]MBU3989221.1 TRAP transporter small permease subunit [Gammaproteobacteria bacterium]MBU4004322.1 TRAP transporter small permease subunit [Gammaproteobacteria bacterium]MBU4019731.1 TRAP transporter small permease subunit [Gammaproteobacteria bacterium]
MSIQSLLHGIDQLSKSVGHAFAWCIVVLTLGTCYEVFVRYVLNDPTSWAFDMSYILYGGLFLMSGAYALSRGAHVRGDVFYRLMPPRVQGRLELVLYVIFFFPGIIALMYSGWTYAMDSFRIGEVSVNSPIGVPIWQLKMIIPAAGALLALQGVAEMLRCIVCIRTGEWPERLHDVEEMEAEVLRKAAEADDQSDNDAAQPGVTK